MKNPGLWNINTILGLRLQNLGYSDTCYRIYTWLKIINKIGYKVQVKDYKIKIQDNDYKIQNKDYKMQDKDYKIQGKVYRIPGTESKIEDECYTIHYTEFKMYRMKIT